jgi:hypothetical protein
LPDEFDSWIWGWLDRCWSEARTQAAKEVLIELFDNIMRIIGDSKGFP